MSYITGKLRHLPGFNWCGIPGYYTTRETGNSFSSLSDDLGKLTFDALATVEVRTTNDVFTSLQTKSEAVEQQTMLGGTKTPKNPSTRNPLDEDTTREQQNTENAPIHPESEGNSKPRSPENPQATDVQHRHESKVDIVPKSEQADVMMAAGEKRAGGHGTIAP